MSKSPNKIIPDATKVMKVKLFSAFNNPVPSVAPIALAKLKTDAAIVPDKAGASLAPIIIFAFKIGVVPKVPTPNKKAMMNAKTETCMSMVNKANTRANLIQSNINFSVY